MRNELKTEFFILKHNKLKFSVKHFILHLKFDTVSRQNSFNIPNSLESMRCESSVSLSENILLFTEIEIYITKSSNIFKMYTSTMKLVQWINNKHINK